MSETDPQHSQYLRRVTFVDGTPDSPELAPVSVPSKLFLDGVDHSEVLAYDRGYVLGHEWAIVGVPEVLVSFVARAEHVTTKTYPSRTRPGETVLSGTHIAGIPVCTPTDHEWELIPAGDGEPDLVQVWIFARRVEILALDQLPADWEIVRRETHGPRHADAPN